MCASTPSTGPERLAVAVGVLRDANGRVLVAQRVTADRYRGLWEFPGGKLEPGESVDQALSRELYEELGVHVQASEPLIEIGYDYPDRRVRLCVHSVSAYAPAPCGRAGQALRWVSPLWRRQSAESA